MNAEGFGTGRATGSFVELNTAVTRSDNIQRTNTPRVEDTIFTAGFTVDTARDGARLDYSMTGDLDWYEFLDDSYDSRLLGYLDGGLTFGIVPERFIWGVRESFSQAVADPLAPPTPANLENINYFTTGPRLTLLLGRNTRLELRGDYSSAESDPGSSDVIFDSGIDSDRYGAGLTLSRSLSQASALSASVDFQRVEFDEAELTPFGDYDRYEALLGYSTRISRTALSIELGSTRIDDGVNQWDQFLVRAEMTRRVTPASVLTLRVMQQTADAADIIRNTFDPTRASTLGLRIASRDPFRDRTISADWRFSRARTGISLGAMLTEEKHELSDALDRTMRDVYLRIDRRLRPTVSVSLSGRYEREKFDQFAFEDEEIEARAQLGWQIGRRLAATLHYERLDRDSSDPAFTATENRVGIELAYRMASGQQ